MAPKTWAHLALTSYPTVRSAPARPRIAVVRTVRAERTKERTVSSHVASRVSCARSDTSSRWSVPFVSFHAVAPSVHPSFPPRKKTPFFSHKPQQKRFHRRRAPSSPSPASPKRMCLRTCVTCDVEVRIPRRASVVARSQTRLWPPPRAFFRGLDEYPPTFCARFNPARRFRRRCARHAPPEARVRVRRCRLGSFRSS